MSILNFVFLAVPVLFLVASVLIASKAVTHGKSRKRTLMMQLECLGLNYKATPSKVKEDTRKGVSENDGLINILRGTMEDVS